MKLKKAGITSKIVITALIVYACVSLVTVQSQVEEAKKARDELIAAVAEASRENGIRRQKSKTSALRVFLSGEDF